MKKGNSILQIKCSQPHLIFKMSEFINFPEKLKQAKH